MRLSKILSICLLATTLISCGESSVDAGASDRQSGKTVTDSQHQAAAPVPPCPVQGEILPGNWFQIRERKLMLTILADSTTYSAESGPGHRVLALYELPSCRQVERHVLPSQVSPGFPYQIADITYNHESELVGISGFDIVYVYDVAGRALLTPLKPNFKTKRFGTDTQSGRIVRLEVWEHYLVGYARDFGAFVFDLQDKTQPRPVIPLAEFKRPDQEAYNAAFLLPSDTKYQVLAPAYYPEAAEFDINPLLPQLEAIDPQTVTLIDSNRFLLLPAAGEAEINFVIDLDRRRLLDLPPELQKGGRPEIATWLKEEFN